MCFCCPRKLSRTDPSDVPCVQAGRGDYYTDHHGDDRSCCAKCCGCIASGMVKLTAASILLLGLAVVGYGIYLLTEQSGGVTYFVLAVGVYASLCGAMGLVLSCKSSPWCTTRIYVILLMVAALFQLSVVPASSRLTVHLSPLW